MTDRGPGQPWPPNTAMLRKYEFMPGTLRNVVSGHLRLITLSIGLIACGYGALAEVLPSTEFKEHPAPVGINAREPSLATLPDGRIVMSWTQADAEGFAVKVAILEDGQWGEAYTVHRSSSLFVNWADFPSVVAMANGTLAVHWLQLSGEGAYQYDVKLAFSEDEGVSWSQPIQPHGDISQREHGFVSMVPDQAGNLTALWLDARSYDNQSDDESLANAMQLRSRKISPDGAMGPDRLVDARTCTCCQTSAARLGNGDVVAVHRDRTAEEIRDISIVRLTAQGWSAPNSLHDDGWEISGCPVNGPAMDVLGQQASVIWFTAAQDEPRVMVAFSDDGAVHFDDPLRIDLGDAAGRVDILHLSKNEALALWIEHQDTGEAIMLCRVSRRAGCTAPQILHINSGRGSVGFPRMTRGTGAIHIAWTASDNVTRDGTTIRVVELVSF